MENLRNALLRNNYINAYRTFVDFMRTPTEVSQDEILEAFPEQLYSAVQDAINYSLNMLSDSKEKYDASIRFGQLIIWEEILSTYLTMRDLRERISHLQLTPDMQSYLNVCGELSRLLSLYASMQVALTKLEDTLGVDRFLDRVSEGTFLVLNEILADAKADVERKSSSLKQKFIYEWNNTNVFKSITHKLIKADTENQICDRISSNCQQVILFVIDGLGYCQYLWQKGVDSQRENFTSDENIFDWLRPCL